MYTHICIYVCTYIYIYIYIDICMYICDFVYANIHVCIFVYMYIYCIYTHTYVYLYMCVCIHILIYVYIYIYMYIYTYIFIYLLVHVYMYTCINICFCLCAYLCVYTSYVYVYICTCTSIQLPNFVIDFQASVFETANEKLRELHGRPFVEWSHRMDELGFHSARYFVGCMYQTLWVSHPSLPSLLLLKSTVETCCMLSCVAALPFRKTHVRIHCHEYTNERVNAQDFR